MRYWGVRTLALVLLVGCYHRVSEDACTLTCSGAGSCPDGEVCSAGMCAPEGDSCAPVDASLPGDTSQIDGLPPMVCGTFGGICVPVGPYQDVVLDGETIDTGTNCDAIVQPGTGQVCVVIGHSIILHGAQSAHVQGPHPLGLFSLTTIVIDGTLEAGSYRHPAEVTGPGADAGCSAPGAPTPSAGGAGGSLEGRGGHGGAANGVDVGGSPASAVLLAGLRAGCPGGDGADQANNGGGAAHGHGGGAIALIAQMTIQVAGVIDASGESGAGGAVGLIGGGGGGSGGVIVIDAPLLQLPGTLLAEGGGGGGGGSTGFSGSDGADGGPGIPAGGGQGGGGKGGTGGDGSGPDTTTDGGMALGGVDSGAGGGGGAGFIHFTATPNPPPMLAQPPPT